MAGWEAVEQRLEPPPAQLHMHLLGTPKVAWQGEPLDLPRRQVRALLHLAPGASPIVLCLDNLHRADSATLDWLAYLGRHLGSRPILLLGAYRREEAGPLAGLRAGLARQGLLRELVLEGLDTAGIGDRGWALRLLGDMAAYSRDLDEEARLLRPWATSSWLTILWRRAWPSPARSATARRRSSAWGTWAGWRCARDRPRRPWIACKPR